MLGYGLPNWLAWSNALVSHNTSPDRTTSWRDGISHGHDLWVCQQPHLRLWSHYHCSHAVPIWLTQYWADMTCNSSTFNECDDATSPKIPDNPVMNWCQLHGFLWFLVSAQLPALEESGDEVMRWANQVLRHSWVTQLWNSHPPGQWGTRHQNPQSVIDWWICENHKTWHNHMGSSNSKEAWKVIKVVPIGHLKIRLPKLGFR
jgi:hypothetical protein